MPDKRKIVICLGSDYNGVIFPYNSMKEAEEDLAYKCRELSDENRAKVRADLQLIELEI